MYMQAKELDKTIGFNNEKVTELASTPILLDLNLVKSVFVGWPKLRYESSTLILYKQLSSPIFQSLSVSQSGIGNTCPDLHFVQYIKA